MKNYLLLFLFVLTYATKTQAQEQSDFKKETIEFLKITGATNAFKTAISQIGMMVSEEKKEAYTKEAMGTLDDLYGKLADLYMEEFTQDEIKELVAFYQTDLGKKLAGKQFELAQRGMILGQSWGMELQTIAQKYN